MHETPKKLQKLTGQSLSDTLLTVHSASEQENAELVRQPTPVAHLPILSAGFHYADKGQHYPAHYHPALELILYRTGHIEWQVKSTEPNKSYRPNQDWCFLPQPMSYISSELWEPIPIPIF
jgi:hypothetical protein